MSLFCSKDNGYLYEKSIVAWKCTNQPHAVCGGHNKLAQMRVVKDMMKESYGRPFFVCSERNSPCTFWQGGDVQPLTRPMCRHGFSCAVLKVKRASTRSCVFRLPNGKKNSCDYFKWAPEEEDVSMQPVNSFIPKPSKYKTKYQENYFENCFDDLVHSFQDMNID